MRLQAKCRKCSRPLRLAVFRTGQYAGEQLIVCDSCEYAAPVPPELRGLVEDTLGELAAVNAYHSRN